MNSTLSIPRIRVDVPRALAPLLKASRYKGAYGGRGGAKSHFFAEQIIVRCYARTTRVVCIREIQNSIKDSVKQLLVDKIAKLGLMGEFEIIETEIRSKSNGSLIIFRGMQSYNSDTIKSLEGYDIAWVEEAQTLSSVSLQLLRPTLRKEGSELWFSWNPRHRTDAVDQFFRKKPIHPDAISVAVNWRDNPWFPNVLRRDMEEDKLKDPVAAEHVWEGGYGAQEGAILARWVDVAEKQGRIGDHVAFDPEGWIEISSDIGFRDTATWWYWQRKLGGFSLLDYDADSGLEAQDWIVRIKARLLERCWQDRLKKIWLPHDAKIKTFQSKHSTIEQFTEGFGFHKCEIVPVASKLDRINAARTVIRTCEFHETNCEDGLDGLRNWEYEWNPDLKVFMKEPLHNWASHPSDGFSYGCQVMQGLPPKAEEKKPDPTAPLTLAQMTELHDKKFKQARRSW